MKQPTKALNLGLVALVCFFFGNGFAQADTFYVANYYGNTVEKFDASGSGSVFVSAGLNGPGGIAFDSSANLYVANEGRSGPGINTIMKFDSSGHGSVFATGLNFPACLAFDKSGNNL